MPKNIIVGVKSTRLSNNERALFAELQPWGIILFARNINDPNQVIALINDCKEALQRSKLMVFIDQEGGRVSRLPSTHWRIPPSPTVFANIYETNKDIAMRACLLNSTLIGLELKALGINANCAPMLDVPQPNASTIISERALGKTPATVISLARQVVSGLKLAGVAPVIKHMPGHGRAVSDSHLELPKVSATLKSLNQWDFMPFQALNGEAMAMTAHIVYSQIDSQLPATISQEMISSIMRENLGFDGLIMTDDINMQALSGSVSSRAQQALSAGCDIVLHCSGEYDEMKSLLNVASDIEGKTLKRVLAAQHIAFKEPATLSPTDIQDELSTLMARYT